MMPWVGAVLSRPWAQQMSVQWGSRSGQQCQTEQCLLFPALCPLMVRARLPLQMPRKGGADGVQTAAGTSLYAAHQT